MNPRYLRFLILWVVIACLPFSATSQNIGINNNASAPDPSSILDVSSTSQGMLLPRMTTVQRNAIVAPAQSLLIYNTTTKCFEFWENGAWQTLACACTPPATPVANAATGITTVTFNANWSAAAGATGYYLDVATDAGFTSFVSGYNNLNVGNVTTYGVSGLVCNTTYYYRLRAYNSCATTASSNTITVTTSPCTGCVLDQSQLSYNCGTSARNLAGYSVFQTFTAGMTGTLCKIDMGFFNAMTGSGTLKIFAGAGILGTLLQSLSVTVSGTGNFFQTFNVSAPVTAGQMYTFQFIPIQGGGLPDPYGVQCVNPEAYPSGEYFLVDPGGTYPMGMDLVFKTYVQ